MPKIKKRRVGQAPGGTAKPKKPRVASTPMSTQILATIRQRILKNEYAKTGGLPPEKVLASEFKVSRYTVRTALQKLVIDGFIRRKRGTGTTIVLRDPQQGTWAVGSLDQMLGGTSPGKVLFAGPVPAKRFPKMARLFEIDVDKSLFQVIRLVQAPRGPLSYTTVFTRLEFGIRVPKDLIPSQYFLTLLEEHCGLRAVRARQMVSAALPPPAAQRALGLDEHDPTLVLQRTFLSRSGEPIEHVEMFCRSDTYSQIVDFYREDEITPPRVSRAGPKSKRKTSART